MYIRHRVDSIQVTVQRFAFNRKMKAQDTFSTNEQASWICARDENFEPVVNVKMMQNDTCTDKLNQYSCNDKLNQATGSQAWTHPISG